MRQLYADFICHVIPTDKEQAVQIQDHVMAKICKFNRMFYCL